MSKKSMFFLIFKLVAMIAMQQQQIILYKRQHPRPKIRFADRVFWVICRKLFKNLWRSALAVVQPETVVRWHRELARLHWRWISKGKRKRRVPQETVELVRHMALENRTWGVPKICGELLKLGIRLSIRTIQRIIRPILKERRKAFGQNWRTFLANHAPEIWASDFFTVTTAGFRQFYVFIVFSIHTREILQWNITSHPTAEWTYQQVLQATWDRKAPRFLIADRDSKYGSIFRKQLKERLRVRLLRTPFRAPKANAFVERCIGSIRRECLDHFIILGENHLRRVLKEYVDYYNNRRPHQGINQRIPAAQDSQPPAKGRIGCRPVLNGLHHDYYRKAA